MKKSLFLILVILAISSTAFAARPVPAFNPAYNSEAAKKFYDIVIPPPESIEQPFTATDAINILLNDVLGGPHHQPFPTCSSEVREEIVISVFKKDSKFSISFETEGIINYDEKNDNKILISMIISSLVLKPTCNYVNNSFGSVKCDLDESLTGSEKVSATIGYTAADGKKCMAFFVSNKAIDLSAAVDETPEDQPPANMPVAPASSGSWNKIDTSTTQPTVPTIPTNKSSGDCSLNPNAVVDGFEWLVSLAVIGLPFVPITFKRRRR